MILSGSYANGFAPRDGQPLYPELWRGCIGAWAPCLGSTGLTLRDWSLYGNHGTLTNMDAGSVWVSNGGKHALSFDGSDDFVSTPARVQFGGRDSFSLSFWLMPLTTGNNATFLAIYTKLHVVPTSYGNFRIYQFSANNNIFSSATSVLTGVMQHFAVISRSATYHELWIDGRLRQVDTQWMQRLGTEMIHFGGTTYFSQYHIGLTHGVSCYDRALSAQEVIALASHPGIAYELAPRRRSSVFLPSHLHYISGSSVRQGSIITGASPLGNVSKIQKTGNISPIPEERFDDRRYYYS